MRSDREVLEGVSKLDDFFGDAIVRDLMHDWSLAQEFGLFLLRINPEEIMGHALLARACRHLGEYERARRELERCQERLDKGKVTPAEIPLFRDFVTGEKHLLGESA